MKYILYTHGGSGNHGCEALARTAYTLVKKVMCTEDEIYIATYRSQEDNYYLKDLSINTVPYKYQEKRNIPKIMYATFRKMGFDNQKWFYRISTSRIIKLAGENTIAISIGGDNYCYGTPNLTYYTNNQLRNKKAKTVLIGCSIDKSAITEEMLEDLSGYSLISVRESITYNTLKERGLKNIVQYPDTAFILPKVVDDSDMFLEKGNVIGINLSPLITEKEHSKGIIIKSFVKLINWILSNTDAKIALIPHVTWKNNDDLQTLRELYENYSYNDRVKLYPDTNCMYLKGIISKCCFLIAARTHASIAAYSCYVPTLVIGYSVKALGIAKDIFGSYENYVIAVQDIYDDTKVLNKFTALYENRLAIKSHLEGVIPQYIKQIDDLEKLFIEMVDK